MLYYTILYYIILYYTILYYIILYYTILYYIILYYTILYYIILYYTILYYIILYYTILYYIILYYTILYYIILYYYVILLYYTILLRYFTISYYYAIFQRTAAYCRRLQHLAVDCRMHRKLSKAQSTQERDSSSESSDFCDWSSIGVHIFTGAQVLLKLLKQPSNIFSPPSPPMHRLCQHREVQAPPARSIFADVRATKAPSHWVRISFLRRHLRKPRGVLPFQFRLPNSRFGSLPSAIQCY